VPRSCGPTPRVPLSAKARLTHLRVKVASFGVSCTKIVWQTTATRASCVRRGREAQGRKRGAGGQGLSWPGLACG
jgi:hypothetical protein